MTIDLLQQKKEELATMYLVDLKKELWDLQGNVVDILSDRLKRLMTSDVNRGVKVDDLKLTPDEKKKAELSPDTTGKIIAFVKEKQESLTKATTIEELENLKKETQLDNKSWSASRFLMPWVVMAGSGATGWGVGEVIKRTHSAEKISETVSIAKTRANMDNVVKLLQLKLRDSQLLPVQKQSIQKSITYFEDARDNAGCINDIATWKKLGKKLPIEVFNKLQLSKDAIKDLASISKDEELAKLLAKEESADGIRKLLVNKWLKNVPEEVVTLLKVSKTAEEVTDITKVLSVAKPIKAVAKGLMAIPVLDLLGAGMDFRVFNQESNQADAMRRMNEAMANNQQQRANFHLGTWVATFGAAIAWFAVGCAASGPPGWIVGVAVWAVAGAAAGVNALADNYYYDVVDFYLRNKENYKTLYRTEIKQAILQATIRGDKNFSLSGTEKFANLFNRSNSIEKNKKVTLEDAYRGICYLEEIHEYPYIQKYNPEYPKPSPSPPTGEELSKYTKQRAELDQALAKRMDYIKKFLPHTTTAASAPEYNAFITSIKGATGISAIEKIITDSKTYQKMSLDTEMKGYTDIWKYTAAIAEKLKKQNPSRFTSLEKLYAQDPGQITEVYYNVVTFEAGLKDKDTYKEKYTTLLPKIEYMKKYYAYKNLWVPPERQKSVGSISDTSYVATEEFLEHMEAGIELKPTTFTEGDIASRMAAWLDIPRFEESSAEYSPLVGQNVIYTIAKEIYGYEGKNDVLALITYFSPDKKSSLGMYYDDGRYININGRWNDKKITFAGIEKLSVDQLMFLFTKEVKPAVGYPGIHVQNANNISTATGNADEVLNKEFQEKIRAILIKEKWYQTKEGKASAEKEIIAYIQKYGTQWYIKLPYYLINMAKRAGIGNGEYFYFTYKNGQIQTTCPKAYIHEKLDFTWIKVVRSYGENVREQLSPQEQQYITYVEQPYKRLMELRSINGVGSHEDELDLPQEFETQIGNKYKQRVTFKESLLGYTPEIAKDQIQKEYTSYHAYFESLYLALLNEVSSHKFSNDIDGYSYLMSVMGNMQRGFFDLENKDVLAGVLPADETKLFQTTIKSRKLRGKTIVELASSKDEGEKKKGLWWAQQVLRTLLEWRTLSLNETTGKIENIHSGWSSISLDKYEKQLTNNLDEKKYIDLTDLNQVALPTVWESTIKTLGDKEEKAHNTSLDVTKQIEGTLANVVRQDQRGNVLYDDKKNTITSRSKSIEIDPVALKIKGLDIAFKDIKELVTTANLLNRFKYKYPDAKTFDYESRAWTGLSQGIYLKRSRKYDIKIIGKGELEQKFPSLLASKDKFIAYINK